MEAKESFYKSAFFSSIGFLALGTYFSILSKYYLGLLSIPFFGLFIIYFKSKLNRIKAVKYIRQLWGHSEKEKKNFNKISRLFNQLKSNDKFYIDDQTWQDLTMKDVYSMMDITLSDPGEQVLYNMLRNPSFNKEELKDLSSIIDSLKENTEVREELQYILYNLGKDKNSTLVSFLWGNIPKASVVKYFYYLMSLLAIAAPFSIIFLKATGGFLIAFVLIINLSLHGAAKKNLFEDIASLGRLGAMVRAAGKIRNVDESSIKHIIDRISKIYNICRKIANRTVALGRIEGIDVVGDYFNIYFLMEEVSYFSVIDVINSHKAELQEMFMLVGKIDALISVANFRVSVKNYCVPEFIEGEAQIKLKEAYHPLLQNPVSNSMEIHRGGIIVTGSNMSGKSTFLRAMGVNALLAQTIATCTAENYTATFLKVLTSISPEDDIMGGKSYYLGEAEALLRIIKSSEDNMPALYIIDEIFRGTNPVERIAAAAEILDYLPNHNSVTMVATHDIELTSMTENHYECYYFTEDVDEDGLKFDYKIRAGISKTRNAIKVLKLIGYPEEIINGASARIQ